MARRFKDPFSALFDLQRAVESSFSSDWLRGGTSGGGAFPPINVFRQGENYLAVVELAGIDRSDLNVQVKDNRIRLSGKKAVQYQDEASVHRRERVGGEFDRTFAVPVQVDPDGVKAEYRNGILALFLPRAEEDKPRSININ